MNYSQNATSYAEPLCLSHVKNVKQYPVVRIPQLWHVC